MVKRVKVRALHRDRKGLRAQLIDALGAVREQLVSAEQQLERSRVAPSQFEVLLRCSDGDRNWCLIRYTFIYAFLQNACHGTARHDLGIRFIYVCMRAYFDAYIACITYIHTYIHSHSSE